MATYGLLIDYEFCTGCQSCEVSCKEEHGYPVGKWGIKVLEDGPWEIEEDHYNWNKIPTPTDLCDLCVDRTAKGREPICVHHCLADVMVYGPVDELVGRLAQKGKQVLFVPTYKPYKARGEFKSKREGSTYDHDVSQVEIKGGGGFKFAAQRGDDSLEHLVDGKTNA